MPDFLILRQQIKESYRAHLYVPRQLKSVSIGHKVHTQLR